MHTIGALSLAPWEVEGLRHSLAPILTFTRRYHRQPHCLSTLPSEIGVSVRPFREDALTLPAFLVERNGKRVVRLNHRLVGTAMAPVAVLHECTHHLFGPRRIECTHKLNSRHERDVWLASALLAVSHDLAAAVARGHTTAADVAEWCRVPEPLVMIRVGLFYVMDGRRRRRLSEALRSIRYWLGRLESWIESAKAWLCRHAVPA